MRLNIQQTVLLSLIIMFWNIAVQAEQVTVGWIEEVALGEQAFRIKAKIDTGADNTSVNSVNPQVYTRDGQEWIKFTLTNKDGTKTTIDQPIIKYTSIKTKSGGRQKRPVIELDICLANVKKRVNVNLVDRSHFKYQVLIGRSFLRPDILVDSAGKLTIPPNCK